MFRSSRKTQCTTALLVLLVASTGAQVDDAGITFCENYEQTGPALISAYESWKAHSPECYQFSYTFLGFTVGPPTPETRTVVRGSAVGLTKDQAAMAYNTLDDFYEFLYEECAVGCPTDGAYECRLTYTNATNLGKAFRIPESIYVDMHPMIADEESIYRISNFAIIDCDTVSVAVGGSGGVPKVRNCEGFAETEKAFRNADALLDETLSKYDDCYDFEYSRLDRLSFPHSPMTVQVRNNKVINPESSGRFHSIWDVMKFIHDECLYPCPDGDGPYKCNIVYNRDGAPTQVMIDYDRHESDEEIYYWIPEFHLVDCITGMPIDNEAVEPPEAPKFPKCESFAETHQEFEKAEARLEAALTKYDACYDFTYKNVAFTPIAPVSVRVRFGETINPNPRRRFNTVWDVMQLIYLECLDSCNDSDGSIQCMIDYNWAGVPNQVFVDYNPSNAGYELQYAIEEFSFVDCFTGAPIDVGTETPPDPPKLPNCEGFTQTEQEFQNAEALLQASLAEHDSCYDFNYKKLQFSPSPPTEVMVQVRKGRTVNFNESREFNSILDVMQLIQTECLDACDNGGQGPAKCTINYNSAGAPTFVTVDYDARIADEELYYSIDDFRFVDCDTGTPIQFEPEEPVQEPNKCVDYLDVQAKLQAAREVWAAPPCYQYSVERVGKILPEYTGPFQVLVVDGVATLRGEYPSHIVFEVLKRVEEWFTLVEANCLQGCPDAGMAHKCTVQFSETMGYPMRLEIDYDSETVDEEDVFLISNFSLMSCGSQEIVPVDSGDLDSGGVDSGDDSLGSAKCVNSEKVQADLTAAQELWPAPPCYQYTVEKVGRIVPGYRGPFHVHVIQGVATVVGSYPSDATMDKTMEEWFALVQARCLQGCPKAGTVYKCFVQFNEMMGYPVQLKFDYDSSRADEEDHFVISGFSEIKCNVPGVGANVTSPQPFTNSTVDPISSELKCLNWETVREDFEEANTKLTQTLSGNDVCYSFSYLYRGSTWPPPEPIQVQVKNGQAFTSKDFSRVGSLEDIMTLIQSNCIDRCPAEPGTWGAPRTCNVVYDDVTGHPTSLFIDFSEYIADEEYGFIMSNFARVDCQEIAEGNQTSLKCFNYEQVKMDFMAAQDKWSKLDPGCYDFTIQNNSEISQSEVIQVHNHKVLDNGSGEINETISTLLTMVEDVCLSGCPEGTAEAVYKCDLEFSDDGSPAQIGIYYGVDGGETILTVSNLTIINCDEPRNSTPASAVSEESSSSTLIPLTAMLASFIFAAF